MAYAANILADSRSEYHGLRLTTFEITFPRLVLAEFNTHRMFSRNSASSRAIPVSKQLKRILEDPFIPERFGINQAGMQSYQFLEGKQHEGARQAWLNGRDQAVFSALKLLLGLGTFHRVFGYTPSWPDLAGDKLQFALSLLDASYRERHPDLNYEVLNVHKQLANRVLEPYMWHTVIVTATEWSNYFALRADKEAQPEIRTIAEMMLDLYDSSKPVLMDPAQWHLPLVSDEEVNSGELPYEEWRKVSAGRCARVSYLTHDGKRDVSKDIELHDRLSGNGHMSPLEHPARPMTREEFEVDPWSGNFYGWHQYRKDLPNEHDFGLVKQQLASAN